MNDATSLHMTIEDGALTISARGIVTKETMRLVRMELLRAAYSAPLERALFDFSKAVLLLTPGAWGEFAEHGLSAEFLPIPSALLVPHTNIDDAWTFCERVTLHGRPFIAFTSEQQAAWWLRGLPERRREPRDPASPSSAPTRPARTRVPGPRD